MSVRAAATEATRDRIVAAAQDAFMSQWYDDVTVRGIAASAGVALQTVLNHFPTKEALCAAANERLAGSIESARFSVEAGDIVGAITTLVDDYERTGDASLKMLAVEERVPAVQPWIALGRAGHERGCEQIFALALDGRAGRSGGASGSARCSHGSRVGVRDTNGGASRSLQWPSTGSPGAGEPGGSPS